MDGLFRNKNYIKYCQTKKIETIFFNNCICSLCMNECGLCTEKNLRFKRSKYVFNYQTLWATHWIFSFLYSTCTFFSFIRFSVNFHICLASLNRGQVWFPNQRPFLPCKNIVLSPDWNIILYRFQLNVWNMFRHR